MARRGIAAGVTTPLRRAVLWIGALSLLIGGIVIANLMFAGGRDTIIHTVASVIGYFAASNPTVRPIAYVVAGLVIAASIVAGIFDVTVSTAARMATLGLSRPSVTARSIAFWAMSRLVSRSGEMLTTQSVNSSGRGRRGAEGAAAARPVRQGRRPRARTRRMTTRRRPGAAGRARRTRYG